MPAEHVEEQPMSAQQLFDHIRRYLGEQFQLSPDQVKEMLPSFITTLATHMDNLEKSLGTGDPLVIGKAGHTIKGALLNLGLTEYAELAFRIEENGKSGDTNTDYPALVASLRRMIEPLFR
ncbi:MAG: Hpt domain-containing protein [Desulfobulbaceae bacterium]|nr:MAG: Hpt domain-containing protein [Desulfobulbaceae bacterium]